MSRTVKLGAALWLLGGLVFAPEASAQAIVHDAEYYILEAQNGQRWAAEDKELDAKLAALRKQHGQPPNIVYVLWDDTTFGAVGFPALQKNFGFTTPNINRLAKEGINFTRMYTEPSCTPTRCAFLTGRHPVRHGMGVVGMPHEFAGLRGDEVTIAEVLSKAGYATAFYGKGHLGDIEESYMHNQGFDEAFFTGYNQILSLNNVKAEQANATIGLYVLPAMLAGAYIGPGFAIIQSHVPLRMRSVAAAINLFILNIIGLGLGPFSVGLISDLTADSAGVESLRYGLLAMIPVGFWGALHYLRAGILLGRQAQ